MQGAESDSDALGISDRYQLVTHVDLMVWAPAPSTRPAAGETRPDETSRSGRPRPNGGRSLTGPRRRPRPLPIALHIEKAFKTPGQTQPPSSFKRIPGQTAGEPLTRLYTDTARRDRNRTVAVAVAVSSCS